MPSDTNDFVPRIGLAYSVGQEHPWVMRAGFGIFYTRIPQIYQSSVINDNGTSKSFLELDNSDYYQHKIFPAYPNALVTCDRGPVACTAPVSLSPYMSSDVSAFAPDFKTPKVQQGSLNVEREIADRFAAGVSYLYVHGVDLIRARDVNLPKPAEYEYPIYDPTGNDFLNSFYIVDSFSNWQTTKSMTCPYPPCLNDVQRPVSQLGAINQFESAASSV